MGMTESAQAPVDGPQEVILGGKLVGSTRGADRAAAEKAAAVADGERRRDTSLDSLDDYRLLLRLRRTARDVAADTGLELTEAAKTTPCHAILAEILRREP